MAAADVAFAQALPGATQEGTLTSSDQVMRDRRRRDPLRAYQDGMDALFVGNYESAITYLRVTHEAFPDDPNVSYALGLAFFGLGDFPNARAPLEHAVNRENAPASARLRLGLTYLALGERGQATAQQEALSGMLAACGCDDYERDRITTALGALSDALAIPVDTDAATSRS
jgi:tetratricopeptide (TPR) repeat protein